jgi:hypothetical protein
LNFDPLELVGISHYDAVRYSFIINPFFTAPMTFSDVNTDFVVVPVIVVLLLLTYFSSSGVVVGDSLVEGISFSSSGIVVVSDATAPLSRPVCLRTKSTYF